MAQSTLGDPGLIFIWPERPKVIQNSVLEVDI